MADSAVQDPPVEAAVAEEKTADSTAANGSVDNEQKDGKTSEDKTSTSENKTTEDHVGNGSASQDVDKKTSDTPEKKSYSRHDDKRSGRNDRQGDRRGGYKAKSFGKSGNRFDPSSAKETDDPVEIRKQVEFYFSDSNLPNDKFLFETVGGSKNNPVPIKTIHSFKRMRRFQPFEAVVEALKESTSLNVVDDDTAIQRKVPLPEGTGSTQPEIQKVFEDKIMSRSVYVKGFGREEPSTQFDIEAWFSKYGATNQVRLRRTDDSSFKGSVFVEFDSEETAKSFLSLDPTPKYNGRDLIIKSKKQYCDDKVDDLNAGAIRAKEPDERDWKARRENDRKKGFPSLHKDGRDNRNRRGGNHRGGRGGRDNRDRRDRDDGGRDGRDSYGRRLRDGDRDDRSDDDEKSQSKDSSKATEDKTKDSSEGSESKKREREEDKEEEAPASKKGAVESDMTGEPEAVEKKIDES